MANRSGAVLTLNHDSCFVRNRSVTHARALKVSDLTGATGNRCGSNRYLKRSAGAGVRLPGRVAELWHASPLRLRRGGINGLLFPQMLHGVISSRRPHAFTRTSPRRMPRGRPQGNCRRKDGRLLGGDAEAAQFPDLLARSSEILRDLLGIALGDPVWAWPLGFSDYFGIRHRRFRDQLTDMLADPDERVTINRRAGEITINFGGDTNQAAQFARSVPDFVLRGRFADLVKLDLQALEHRDGNGWVLRSMNTQR